MRDAEALAAELSKHGIPPDFRRADYEPGFRPVRSSFNELDAGNGRAGAALGRTLQRATRSYLPLPTSSACIATLITKTTGR